MEFWIIWFTIGLCLTAAFVCIVLPKLLLKVKAAALPICDRALGRSKDKHGDVLLCEPAPSARPYIRSYRIATDGKRPYFCGEWARKVACIRYELVVFNAANAIIEVIRVKETFNGRKETHITYLPKGADFVSLRVLSVDDMAIPDERRPFNGAYACWLSVFSVAAAAAVDVFLWLFGMIVLFIANDFSSPSELPAGTWAALLVGAGVAVIVAVWVISLLRFFLLRKRRSADES